MRKLIVDMMLSLDGFFEGPHREIDWFHWDSDMEMYSVSLLHSVDAILLGRVAYQLFSAYWPTEAASRENPRIAPLMNSLEKIAFSTTLDKVEWQNTRLVKGDLGREISRLKAGPGKDLVMFGGAGLLASLVPLGLVDEYRFRINPLILGNGRPLFKDVRQRLDLKTIKVEAFGSGVAILYYRPAA